MVLVAGQICVTVTVFTGIVEIFTNEKDEVDELRQKLLGSFLVVIHIAVIGIAVWQQRTERLNRLLETIKEGGPIDKMEFSALWKASAKISLADTLLKSMRLCVSKVQGSAGEDSIADAPWEVLT